MNIHQKCKKYNEQIDYIYPSQRRIIAIGDLHGDMDALKAILINSKLIKDDCDCPVWTGNDTFLVLVGDTVDSCRSNCGLNSKSYTRGDIYLLDYLEKLRISINEQGSGKLIILIGNHELMQVDLEQEYKFLRYVSDNDLKNMPENNSLGLTKKILEKIEKDPIEARRQMFLPGNKLAVYLACTRICAIIIGNYIFVHAGIFQPGILHNMEKLKDINKIVAEFLLGEFQKGRGIGNLPEIIRNMHTRKSIFWNRTLGVLDKDLPLSDPRCSEYMSKLLKTFKVHNIVIGHTPNTEGISKTCEGIWRIDGALSNGFLTKTRQKKVIEYIEILNDVARIITI